MKKCRTDSPYYHDPDNVMTEQQEKEAAAKRKQRIESFLSQFVWDDTCKPERLMWDIITEDGELRSTIVCMAMYYVDLKEEYVREKPLYKAVNKACRKWAEHCIDAKTDAWSD